MWRNGAADSVTVCCTRVHGRCGTIRRRMAPLTPESSAVPPGDITLLLHAWRRGDAQASDRLFGLVYQELKWIAARRVRMAGMSHVDSTEIVHEAMLRLLGNVPAAEDRQHFFRIAAAAIRYALIDLARRHMAEKRGGGVEPVTLSMADTQQMDSDRWLEVEDALKALDTLDGRKCRVVELALLVGLGQQEIAEALGLSLSTVERDLRFAKAWLRDQLAP